MAAETCACAVAQHSVLQKMAYLRGQNPNLFSMDIMALVQSQLGEGGVQQLLDKTGINADQLQTLLPQLLSAFQSGADAQTIAQQVSQSTGLDNGMVAKVVEFALPHLQKILGNSGEGGGMLGSITGFLDQDKDGNAMDDIAGMVGGLFK
jgi:hypothetical protein